MRTFLTSFLAATAAVVALPSAASADGDWGTIKGQFVLDGTAPELAPLVTKDDPAAKDPEICSAEPVPNQSLVVDAETKGIANIVLFPNRFKGDVHPDLKEPAKEVVLDQKGCVFLPHFVVMQEGQSLRIKSDDGCAHNARGTFIRNGSFNTTIKANDREGEAIAMKKAEPLPLPIKCDIHSYMQTWVMVGDSPYTVLTDKEGRFEIKNFPAGDFKFKVWHERGGWIDRSLKVEVNAGETTDIGVVKVAAADLEE